MTFDISDTLAPNSDQLDAVDLLGGDRTFTIANVSRGDAEQPVQIHLAEFPRPWRPGKSMRRVLAACWGTDANAYVGRRVTLYCDPDVIFGKEKVGGTRIRALSHIEGVKKIPLLISRGKAATFTVQPLKDAPRPATITDEQVADLVALMDRKGIPVEARVSGAAYLVKQPISDLSELTVVQWQTVAGELEKKPDVAVEGDPFAAAEEQA